MLGAMRLCPSLVAIATCLAVAGCGGSLHGSGNAGTTATVTPAVSSQTATAARATATNDAASTTTRTSAPPEVPKHKRQKSHGPSHAASQGAHVETNVTVSGAGDVSPPVVSVPSGVGIVIHITNRGSAAATVALGVPTHPSVHVGPGASGTVQTGGLKDGTYRILVNGTPRGQLMIGAQGGP